MAERPSPDRRGAERETTENGALEATGAYEADGSVVLYDTEQPLAWVQSDTAVTLDEMT